MFDYGPHSLEMVYAGKMHHIKGVIFDSGKKIFIGDLKSANDLGLLQSNNITTIISLLDEEDFKELNEFSGIVYNKFIIEDDGQSVGVNIIPICEKSREIINSVSEGNILVHCYAGKSRSASVVIFYLMTKDNISFSKARKIVKNSRSIVNPIPYYKKQLISYRENNK